MDNEEIRKLLQELKETSDTGKSVRSKVVKIHFDTPEETEKKARAKRRAEQEAQRRRLEEEAREQAREEARENYTAEERQEAEEKGDNTAEKGIREMEHFRLLPILRQVFGDVSGISASYRLSHS